MSKSKKKTQEQQQLTRRQFIKSTAAGAAAIYMAPSSALGKDVNGKDVKSRVVIANHARMIDSDESINTKSARQSVDEALLLLTQEDSIKDAWMQIFPDLKTQDTIGLKVNAVNFRCPTHPEVVYAITDSMVDSLGINPNNIIIWDRATSELKKASYTINQSQNGVQCFGTIDKFDFMQWMKKQKQKEDGIGYDQKQINVGEGKKSRLSNILTRLSTYMINVPVLKNHQIAGITLSLKNHYGTIDNPEKCHANYCDPFVAKINTTPQIKNKTKLIICDAVYGVYKGGPGGLPHLKYKSILAATDPVALDYTGMQIINNQRKLDNLDIVNPAMAVHLKTAQKMGLGTCNPDNIQVKKSIIS